MIFQNSRLHVWNHVNSHTFHFFKETLRVGKSLVVPVKGIAQVVLLTGRITAGQPEVVHVNMLVKVLLNHLVNFLITVFFQFRIVHSGGCVSQRLLGRHSLPSGQERVAV